MAFLQMKSEESDKRRKKIYQRERRTEKFMVRSDSL